MNNMSCLAKAGRLRGLSALVTGANSGIGAAIAEALAAEGASVAVNYVTNENDAEKIAEEINKDGGKSIAMRGDISKEGQVRDMFRKMCRGFGIIDILVNNAGIQKDSDFVDMALSDWQKVLDVNLTGQFLCAGEAAKEFIRRGVVSGRSISAGKIICISSVHEVIPWARHCLKYLKATNRRIQSYLKN